MRKSKKLYRLGQEMPLCDANRILGLRKKTTLSWQEFQELRKKQNITHNAQI